MSHKENGAYRISHSRMIGNRILRLHQQATRQGRGVHFTLAFERIIKALRRDPLSVGEPVYTLAVLGLQVRTVVVAPLVIDFAVDDRRAIVYLKGCKLLSASGS